MTDQAKIKEAIETLEGMRYTNGLPDWHSVGIGTWKPNANTIALDFALSILSKLERGELVEANRWISVSERLPEMGDSYLVVIKEKDVLEDKWNYAVDVACNYGSYIDNYWDTFNDWCEGQEVHITHWQPLPEPAGKEQK